MTSLYPPERTVVMSMTAKVPEDMASYKYPYISGNLPKVAELLSETSLEVLLEENIGDNEGILIFDDISNADPRIQQSVLDIVQFGRIAGKTLGKNVRICCIGNNTEDNTGAAPWNAALLSRCFVRKFEPSMDAWLACEENKDMAFGIVLFLYDHPEWFAPAAADERFVDDMGVTPCPRAWSALGVAMHSMGGMEAFQKSTLSPCQKSFFSGFVGEKAAAFLSAHMGHTRSYPRPDEIVQNPVKAWAKVDQSNKKRASGVIACSHGVFGWLQAQISSGCDIEDVIRQSIIAVDHICNPNHMDVSAWFVLRLIKLGQEKEARGDIEFLMALGNILSNVEISKIGGIKLMADMHGFNGAKNAYA
jgi:hypothetical protein